MGNGGSDHTARDRVLPYLDRPELLGKLAWSSKTRHRDRKILPYSRSNLAGDRVAEAAPTEGSQTAGEALTGMADGGAAMDDAGHCRSRLLTQGCSEELGRCRAAFLGAAAMSGPLSLIG